MFQDQLFVGGPGMFLQSGNIMSVDLKSGATLEQEQFLQIDAALRNGTVDSLAGKHRAYSQFLDDLAHKK